MAINCSEWRVLSKLACLGKDKCHFFSLSVGTTPAWGKRLSRSISQPSPHRPRPSPTPTELCGFLEELGACAQFVDVRPRREG